MSSLPKGDLIVEAMSELRLLRDNGVPVSASIDILAEHYGLPAIALRRRAEASWGSPLETDRDRHAAYFEGLENKAQSELDARQSAKRVWEANRPGFTLFSWWRIDWEVEIDKILDGASLDDRQLEEAARSAFLSEAKRLDVRERK